MLKRISTVVIALTVALFVFGAPNNAEAGGSTFAVQLPIWASPSTGDIAGTSVTTTLNPANPIASADYSGADFSAHPQGANEQALSVNADLNYTFTFNPSVTDVHLYLTFWRGTFAGCTSACTYTFNHSNGVIESGSGGTLVGNVLTVPDPGFFSGIIRFPGPLTTLSVTSNATLPSSQVVNVALPLNSFPVPAPDAYAATANTTLNVAAPGVLANDSDPDGHSLTASLQIPPPSGSATVNADGSFSYTPNPGYVGPDFFVYQVDDGFGGTVGGTFVSLTVNPPANQPPVTVDDAYNTAKNIPLNVAAPGVLANDSDPDGDPLRAFPSSNPSNGVAVLNLDGSFTYTPNAGFSGQDSFTYVSNDFTVNGNIATIFIDVVNTPPVTVDDAYNTACETVLNVAAPGVLANDSDPDGDPLRAFPSSNPSNGVAVLNLDGSFTYTPNAGFSGQDSFTYVSNDFTVNGNIATITIDVGSCNNPPIANNDFYDVIAGVQLVVPAPGILANDSDPDGDPITIDEFELDTAEGGTFNVAPDGSFTYDPPVGYVGIDFASYVISDDQGGIDDDTFVQFTIKGADALIADAQTLLDGLLAGGDLSQKNYDKLSDKLDKITEKLGEGDNVAACNQTTSFESKISDMLSAGDISQATFDALQQTIDNIQASIPC